MHLTVERKIRLNASRQMDHIKTCYLYENKLKFG